MESQATIEAPPVPPDQGRSLFERRATVSVPGLPGPYANLSSRDTSFAHPAGPCARARLVNSPASTAGSSSNPRIPAAALPAICLCRNLSFSSRLSRSVSTTAYCLLPTLQPRAVIDRSSSWSASESSSSLSTNPQDELFPTPGVTNFLSSRMTWSNMRSSSMSNGLSSTAVAPLRRASW
jgi:hypothetical protein